MAQPFLRIDLSNQAKDFQNIVIEAGWPLLDKANANYQILRKWLGSAVAEPERKGEEVVFYLRNENGARIDQPRVKKINDKELAGIFKGELHTLLKKLETAEPKNTSEKNLHARALKELKELNSEERANDRRCCFFKYQDERDKKKWRLVWAPGYRRKDEQPARPIVCTNPTCSLLFLERADTSDKCPRCNTKPAAGGVAAGDGVKKSRLPLVLVLLLLIAVLGGAGWWYINRDTGGKEGPAEAALAVSPESATITWDGRAHFVATFTDNEGNEIDVTHQVAARSENPKIARNNVQAKPIEIVPLSTGKTELIFVYYDANKNKHSATVSLTVEPRRNPKAVTIEPATVRLGLGTTAKLKMFGEYEDGRKEDLTDASEWNWEDLGQSGPVFAYKGDLQGINIGKTKLRARYRATPESEYVIAEADVEVSDVEYSKLNLSLASENVAVGQDPGVTVEAVSQDGKTMSVLGSSLLKLEVEPQTLADVSRQPPYVYPLEPGSGKLRATFRGISKELDFEVVDSATTESLEFAVNPKQLKLAVGEIADVDVPGPGGLGAVKFSSSDLDVVEITPRNRLIGKKPGKATVTVSRDDQQDTVDVEVAQVPFEGLAIDPAEISVRVDDVAAFRVLGGIDEGTQVEIDPQMLEWVRFPTSDYVEVDRDHLDVRGLQPTGDDAKTLTVRLGELEASAKIRVIPGPLELALEPAGEVELPVGQKQVLKVIATYGNGQTEEVPASRVEWLAEPVSGLTLSGGEVSATEPEAGPLAVSVRYQDQTSNEVKIRSGPSAPVVLALAAEPAQIEVGKAGQLVLTATTPGGQQIELDMNGVKFESEDSDLAEVHEATGGFRGMSEGNVTLTATHPSSPNPVSVEVAIAPPAENEPPKPQGVQIVTESPQPIVLPMGVVFVDLRVIADIDGTPQNVTEDSVISVEGDPETAAIAVRNGGIVGVRPGEATVKAEFAGQEAENKLTFTVTDKLELDGIQVGPPHIRLAVGENTRLDAIGILEGRKIGLVTDHPEVTWKSENPEIAQAEGPLVAAVSEGKTGVSAQFQDLASEPAVIEVVGEGAPTADNLQVEPAAITLRPGESREIGRGVRVFRGDADFSRQAKAASANPEIVSYDEETHTIKANLPGNTRVTLAVGDQMAELDVTVLAETAPTAGGRVVIEPGSGTIAVAERLPIEIFLITAEGERVNMTASALLNTSDKALAVIEGSAVRGVAPGTVTITANLPGVDEPGSAVFNVENIDFTRIQVDPARIDIASGEKTRFEISVTGPGGRRILGADPDLTLTEILHVDDESQTRSHDVPRDWRHYEGNVAGNHALNVKWRNLETTVPCRVRDGRITGIVIRPADASIGVGAGMDYQVFARRGRSLSPLSALDGVDLSVGNTVIASKTEPFRVEGLSEGTTQVIAQYGSQQARARLRVGPRTTPVAPAARPVALRIHPDTFQLELGTPGDLIRVVRLNADGTTDEVAHLSEITADPEGIVEIQSTPSGPMLKPKSIGQTQIHAKLGDLETQRPMLVEVTDQLPGRPRVVIGPRVVRLNVGERESLSRVAVIPAPGGSPIELPYKISTTPNNIFAIENDRVIRGLAAGEALATVTIADPESKYDGEYNTVIVRVDDPTTHTTLGNDAELELTGPTRTTEGSEVGYRVRLVAGGSARDVTNDSALVLAAGDEEFARLEPGCRLVALKPGTVNLRARFGGQISNSIPLRIDPLATDFERLVLEIDTRPIGVGESRSYQVWGHPRSGGPRQDLTGVITTDRSHASRPHIRFNVIEPSSDADVAAHASPNIIGRNPGTVSIQAAISDRLVSNEEKIAVGGRIVAPVDLRVEPSRITSRVGETTPPLKVLVRVAGDRSYRELDPAEAEYAIVNNSPADPTEYLEAVSETKGRFLAKKPGETRIRVSYGDLQTFANVAVVYDPFQSVVLGDPNIGVGTFVVPITVTTDRVAGNLEYRVYRQGDRVPAEAGWKDTAARGDTQFVSLESPTFKLVKNNLFRVVIEARKKGTKSVDRYPYAFTLQTGRNQSQP